MTRPQVVAGDDLHNIILAADRHCSAHRTMYGSPIGDDGVLSHGTTLILRSVEELLNGELGRRGGATLSRALLDVARCAGLLAGNGGI